MTRTLRPTRRTSMREARIAAGLTQRQVADRALCTVGTVHNIERGRSVPNFRLAYRLGVVLDCDPRELFDLDGEELAS